MDHKPIISPSSTDVVVREGVDIEVQHDGRKLWINVDGVCALRLMIDADKTMTLSCGDHQMDIRKFTRFGRK